MNKISSAFTKAGSYAVWSAGLAGVVLLLFIGAGYADKKPPIGEAAPDFTLTGLSSKETVTLSKMKGKVVLVDFWASWCVPCRQLMPQIAEMKTRLPDLEIVAISVDVNRAKAITFLRSIDTGLRAVHDSKHAVADAYAVERMPTCFLIDKQGNLRYRHDGYSAQELGNAELEAGLLLSEHAK